MPRPPFTVAVAGVTKIISQMGTGETVYHTSLDSLYASETSEGAESNYTKGWRAPLPYSLAYTSYRRAKGTSYAEQPGFPQSGQSSFHEGFVGATRFNSLDHFDLTVTEFGTYDTSLANRALIKARLKLKRKAVDLGVAFAERKQTAMLLGDTATRLARSFNNLKRGRVRAAMRDLGLANSRREPRGSNVPKKWLELQYGWKPFLSDVFGACDALSRRSEGHWRVTAKAHVSSRDTWEREFTGLEMSKCVAEAERGAFVRIDALPSNDLTMSLASLGVTNPLLIVWELVPYSFVVDWALPVGAWLDSLDATLGFSDIQISSSRFVKASWVDNGLSGPDPQNGWRYENKFVGSKRHVRMVRSVSGDTLPSFPSIKDPRSLGHMANGLALLSQAFGRSR